ncbi:hypothetical protein CLOSTHATH_02988 [Hungatella hathewayi DSM 13479]|uniref:Uncharacterized protein n=1 Tax=Hungatella hathewayi DSM 13479 TaxID=566550 RepID=D3AHA0_9FIRM|nr:hypothetical protein CLOSTHATH_02988 [Hungatella hathewayi DSM 13479]
MQYQYDPHEMPYWFDEDDFSRVQTQKRRRSGAMLRLLRLCCR